MERGFLTRRGRAALLQAAATGALLSFAAPALAQTTGAQVVAGQAIVASPSASSTVINQTSSKAIINWQNFSVGAGASVQFNQPDSASLTLNRVVGAGQSAIDGSIKSNGQVWLINPNGVLFGKGAQVNVGGLLATTSDISNANFLSGNYAFEGAPAGSAVVNKGSLKVAPGGSVVLSAPKVVNHGIVAANAGHVVLGGADAFTVDFKGDHLLSYKVTTAAHGDGAGVSNDGVIKAAGGTVLLTARAAAQVQNDVVNNSGVIRATSAHAENGEIVLDAGDGGAVNSGTLVASGSHAGTSGGTVKLLGQSVTVADGASIDVSGDAGGGTVLIGGNLHGAGPETNAQTVTVGKADIRADAVTTGNGGTVAIYSTGHTSVVAGISARGGAVSGNGGMVETSGHALQVGEAASVTTAAPMGVAGTWLLDPQNIIISTSGTQSASQAFASNPGTTATISPTTINAALGSGNVSLQASTDITVASALTITATTANRLTLDAGRSVILSGGSISYPGGAVSLIANDPAAVASDRLSGPANLASGSFGITAATVDLMLFSNGVDGSSIGTASRAFNVFGGKTYINTTGANVFLSSGGNSSLTLGNPGHTLAVDMGAGNLVILSNGVTQTAPLSLHDLSITTTPGAGTGNVVTLTNVSNAIGGTVSVAAIGGSQSDGVDHVAITNAATLTLGNIIDTPDTGSGDRGSMSLTSKSGDVILTGNLSAGQMTINAQGNITQTGGTITSYANGAMNFSGGLALNAFGGSISLPNANVLQQTVAATGNGSETAITGLGQLAFGAKNNATISLAQGVAVYAASAGGTLNITTTGSTTLKDAGGNSVKHYSEINIFNPVSSGGILTLHAAGDLRQMTGPSTDVHLVTSAGLLATSDLGLISLTDGGHPATNSQICGGICLADPGNQVGGYAIFNSAGNTAFTNTITTVIGGPDYPTGAPVNYTPPNSTIGGNLDVEVTDANMASGHANLILAGRVHTQNNAGLTILHATGDLQNNSGSGTIYADNLSLVSDFGSVGGDDGTHWTFGNGSNSGGTQNLHASAANAIVINPGDLNIGVTGLTGGLTAQSVLIFGNGAVTQNSGSFGTITTGSLDIHSSSNSDIVLSNVNNRVTGGTYLRTGGNIYFSNSVATTLNQASGDGLDATNKPLLADNVSIFVQDPTGATHPGLTLGNSAINDSNGITHYSSVNASGNIVLQADGAIVDNYTAGNTQAGYVAGASLTAIAGAGAISLTNPFNHVLSLGANTSGQNITFATQQTDELDITNGGINAGQGQVLLTASNARILGGDPIVGGSVGLVGASMLIGDVEAQSVSASTSGGEIELLSSGALVIGNTGSGAGINSRGGAVTLLGDTVSQASGTAGAILAGDLEAASNKTVTLNNAANAASGMLVLVSGGNASFVNSVATKISSSIGVGTVKVQSAGDLTILNGASVFAQASSGDAVVLATSGNFINNGGSGAITVTGDARWLVYSASPANDVFGGLNSNNTAIFSTTYPTSVQAAGNRYVFASKASITVTAGNLSKVYGADGATALATDFTVSGGSGGVTGAYLGDSNVTFTGTPSITSTGAAVTADVGTYVITAAQGTLQASNGSSVVFQNGQLTVGKRALTATLQGNVTKTYDGTNTATLTQSNYASSNVMNNDAVSVANTAGTYADADAGTGKIVSVSGLTLTGAKAGNYSLSGTNGDGLPVLSGAVGVIQQKALTVALQGSVSKTFDGNANATLTESNYSALRGVVNNDAVSLASLPVTGTYADAAVGFEKTVTVSGLSLTGAKAANYTIAATASGIVGAITAAQVVTLPNQGDGQDKPQTQIVTATVATQNTTLTRPAIFDVAPTIPDATPNTPPPTVTGALAATIASPIAQLATDTSSSGTGNTEPPTSADAAGDFLVSSLNGGASRGGNGVLIPGLLRTTGRARSTGVPTNLSAWGNPALWQW